MLYFKSCGCKPSLFVLGERLFGVKVYVPEEEYQPDHERGYGKALRDEQRERGSDGEDRRPDEN